MTNRREEFLELIIRIVFPLAKRAVVLFGSLALEMLVERDRAICQLALATSAKTTVAITIPKK